MDFTISVAPPVCCTCVVDDPMADVSIDCTETAVSSIYFGAKCSTNAEGTAALTIGMAVGIEGTSISFEAYFSFIRISI